MTAKAPLCNSYAFGRLVQREALPGSAGGVLKVLAQGSGLSFAPRLSPNGQAPARTARRGSRSTSWRSEEHTSELQSLMRISYAVFCLKKKNRNNIKQRPYETRN